MMIKLPRGFFLCVVLLIMIGCTKHDSQPGKQELPYDYHKSAVSVPFKGGYDVYVSHVIHMPPPPPLEQLLHGTGKVTHLGKSNISLHQYWWPPSSSESPDTGEGRIFFASANGDLLLAEYEDGLAYHLSPTMVEITFTGNFTNGGTGRFEYATGFFTWKEIFNPITNEGTATVDGEISFGTETF